MQNIRNTWKYLPPFFVFRIGIVINFSPGERVVYATTSAAIMVSVFNKGKPTEAINDSISKFQ